MLQNFLVLVGIAVVAFVITICFWNRKNWVEFNEWWNAEGFPIWAIIGFGLVVLAFAKDWLR